MIFRRLYDDALAQASYLIGFEQAGEALVIDPNLDIDSYVRAAATDGLRITHVTETHIHADFASGSRMLAAATGAALHVSDEGGDGWRYEFRSEPGVYPMQHGDRVTVGKVHLQALHTPGHTPEHLTFLLTDSARSSALLGAVTGDFLFVGDVGRPDLLERAAGEKGTMRAAAATLYGSVQRFKEFPDHLQIWPGHGAGSACGKAMGSAAMSTLGYERVANWALAPMSESEFVEHVLAGQPTAPPYFGPMKKLNREGAMVPRSALPRSLDADTLATELERGGKTDVFVLDVRNQDEWDWGHIAGATHIPLPELHTRLGELPRGRQMVVHCQRGPRAAAAAATLDAAGFTDVHVLSGGMAAWEARGHAIVR
jgi:hydroxyacylglutathione hydrolase